MSTSQTDTPQALNGFTASMTKDEINDLPLQRCGLPITVINEPSQEASALETLRREAVLGFDTETRPAFRKGQSFLPSLVQLATESEVYLIQIVEGKLSEAMIELLADEKVLKVGVGLDHEVVILKKLAEFEPAGFVELGPLADKVGVQANGLRNLTACVLGFRISKRAQLSNWSRRVLTPDQINYAATDAWVSREIHQHLIEAGADLIVEAEPDTDADTDSE